MPTREKIQTSSHVHLKGIVLGFNLSSIGSVEGVLVETANGPEQVNFQQHEVEALARSITVGANVDLSVTFDSDAGDHRVYRYAPDEFEITGRVVRMNYAPHGVVDGYFLEDGTFLYVSPEDARVHRVCLHEYIKATGTKRQGVQGPVLEVRTIERMERLGKRHDENGVSTKGEFA